MGSMKFYCTVCSQSLEADDSAAGSTITCPTCQRPTTVPGKAAAVRVTGRWFGITLTLIAVAVVIGSVISATTDSEKERKNAIVRAKMLEMMKPKDIVYTPDPEKFRNLKLGLKEDVRRDEVEGTMHINYNNNFPNPDDVHIYAEFSVVPNKRPTSLFLVFSFSPASGSHFRTFRYTIRADEKVFRLEADKPEKYSHIETVTVSKLAMLLAIINSKKAILRFEGADITDSLETYSVNKDRDITAREKIKLLEMLEAYKAAGGTIYVD